MVLTINGTDFGQYVNPKTYNVVSESQYQTWTDANGIEHRVPYRQKVSGDFQLEFWDVPTYETLFTALGLSNEAYSVCYLPVNNVHLTSQPHDLYIETEPEFAVDFYGQIIRIIVTLKVVER